MIIRCPSVAKSIVTATNWCSRPNTDVCVSISGSSAIEELKPPTRSTRSPAACTADTATMTRYPSASPVASWSRSWTTRSAEVSAGACASSPGVSGSASAIARLTRAWPGMPRVLNGGVMRTNAAVRVTARRKAAAIWPPTASCRPVTTSCLEQRRDDREEVVREALQRPQGPGAGEDEDEGRGEELGQERQRRFLNLRRRLHDRQEQADDERGDEHRPGDLDRGHHCHADDLDDLVVHDV